MALMGLVFACGVALAAFTRFYPYDMWWAGSLWSQSAWYFWGQCAIGFALSIWMAQLGARKRPGAREAQPPAATPWGILLPLLFFLYCLIFPAGGAWGDPIVFEPGKYVPYYSSPGAGLFSLGCIRAGELFLGSGRLGLRIGLALLGALWCAGLMELLKVSVGGRRGVILGAGLTFSLASAQFAGYFEESGMVAAFIPLLVLAAWTPSRKGRWALAGVAIALAGVWHAATFCLAPAVALGACSCHTRRLRGRAVGAALLVGVSGAAFGLALATPLRLFFGQDASLGQSLAMATGSDGFPFVAFVPTQLDSCRFSSYLLFSGGWFWERAQFLGAAGPGVLALLALGLPLLRERLTARTAVLLLGAAGPAALFLFWGFDWGMVRDWNLVIPWLTASALSCLLSARARLRRWPLAACIALAIALAAPGVAFTLHNCYGGAKAHLPNAARWERTSGRGKHLYLVGRENRWVWREVGPVVAADAPRLLRVRLTPARRSPGLVDRLEWRPLDPGLKTLGVDAADLPGVAPLPVGRDEMGAYDGRWGLTAKPFGEPGNCVNIFRREPAAALTWSAAAPPGRYRLFVRAFQHKFDPVSLVQILRWEIDTAPLDTGE